jgi:hypothetical protein
MTAWRNWAGEPPGLVRLCSPVLLTQRCLAHAHAGYMTLHQKVSVYVEATDHASGQNWTVSH